MFNVFFAWKNEIEKDRKNIDFPQLPGNVIFWKSYYRYYDLSCIYYILLQSMVRYVHTKSLVKNLISKNLKKNWWVLYRTIPYYTGPTYWKMDNYRSNKEFRIMHLCKSTFQYSRLVFYTTSTECTVSTGQWSRSFSGEQSIQFCCHPRYMRHSMEWDITNIFSPAWLIRYKLYVKFLF